MERPFHFARTGGSAEVCFEGQPILRFESNAHFFGGVFRAYGQVMIPGGTVEMVSLQIFSSYDGTATVSDVDYQVESEGRRFRLRITPKAFRHGATLELPWREEVVLEVEQSESGRFLWTQEANLSIRDALGLDAPPEGFCIHRFHHQDGRPGRFFQFADPQPVGGTGPAVPMQRDWTNVSEPDAGPGAFTKAWRRRYTAILFENPDGTFSWSELNRQKWHHLTLDNRRARPCAAQGAFYLIKDSGEALRYRIDAPSHYHHVCEWGMDFHCWCDLEPFAVEGVIPAGTHICAVTRSDLTDAHVVEPLLAQARRIELTGEERAMADFPAYEEPENTFAFSALEHPDAQPWEPTSEGCRWERTGGYKPGSGVLVIENRYAGIGSWEQPLMGPSHWGNPFLAGARYRFSAWIRWEATWNDPSKVLGPQIGVDFFQYDGPSCNAAITRVPGGWSESFVSAKAVLQNKQEWQQVILIPAACPAYVLRAVLKLRFSGRGTAWFSNVRWEPV